MGKTNFTFVQRLLVVVTMVAFAFTQNAFAQAAGEDCASATAITTTSDGGAYTGSTVGTVHDAFTCGTFNSSLSGNVWYTFTTDGTGGAVTFDLCASDYDTKIWLFSGSCGTLVCEDSNDDNCGLQSSISPVLAASTTYYLVIGGFSGNEGNYDLGFSNLPLAMGPPVGGTQCDPPVNGTTSNVTGTSATFTFSSVNTPVEDHCWNFYIGNEGFDCDENEEFIAATVCNVEINGQQNLTSNNPLVDIVSVNNASGQVVLNVSGLQPGTFYEWSIFETCDGNPDFNNWDCDDATFGPFQTFDDPITVVATNVMVPSCPPTSPGFVPNGSFCIDITDSPTCVGTYDIVLNSSPADANLDVTGYTGVAAGEYCFNGAADGNYNFTIFETSACNPVNTPLNFTVTVGPGVDLVAPVWYITDILGNIITDNDPATPEGGSPGLGVNNLTDLGYYALPEGSCSYQMQLYAFGSDDCDGIITDPAAVTWDGPFILPDFPGETVFPNTNVIVTPDGFGTWLLDINWAAGQTFVAFNMVDDAGNGGDVVAEGLWLTYYMDEWINPDVSIVGIDNITIPHCADSREISFTVYVDDLCDQFVEFDNLSVCVYDLADLGNPICLDPDATFPLNGGELPADGNGYGVYTLDVTPDMDGRYIEAFYTDTWGNVGVVTVQLTVEQAAADEPALVYASDENLTIPYCEDEVYLTYSFQVYDDCAPVDVARVVANFDDDGMGLVNTWIDQTNPNLVYFAFEGFVSAGAYFPEIFYNEVGPGAQPDAQPLVIVNQQQNQAPDITLPGNLNFTIPVCEDELITTLGVYVQDDCDDSTDDFTINFLGATFPGLLNWEWVDNGYIELLVQLTPGTHFIGMEVTDSDGATTYTDAQITVTDQPDNFNPIIVYPSVDFDIELDPCDDPIVPSLDFHATVHDNCGVDTWIVQYRAYGIYPGIVLPVGPFGQYVINNIPVGNHIVHLYAVDVNGNETIETFEINVTQEPAEEDNLACIADLNITLDDYCEAVLSPEIVLTGEWGCLTPDDFAVTVIDSDPSNGDLIDGCGTFGYSIEYVGEGDANFTICWGEVTSEDKTSPVVECPHDVYGPLGTYYEFICTDLDRILIDGVEYYTVYGDGTTVPGSMSSTLSWILGQTGSPVIWDNCDKVRVAVWDEVEESDCGYDVITRHFEVADRYESDCTGAPMTDHCTQQIYVRKANHGDVWYPNDIVELSCAYYGDEVPGPEVTGFPTVHTVYGDYELDDSYCNMGATYEDSPAIDICANSYKVIRTWSVIDWCVEPAYVETYTQIIKVGDFEAPSISCNLVDTDWDGVGDSHPVYSTGPFDCTAAFPVPAPIVTDNCNTYEWYVDVVILVEEEIYNQWGQPIGVQNVKEVIASYGPFAEGEAGPYVSGVPMSVLGEGVHWFHYTVTDVCDNTNEIYCPFEVVDDIAPVAVCDDDLHISVGGEGYARVYAEDVDEGSNDNCELVSIEVRRAGGVWGPWVDFDCDDVHNYVTIELRVWDASGNSNICWLEVLVEDKINPYCHAPHNTSLHCDDHELLHIDWDDAAQLDEVFGAAWAEDNCNATAEQIAVSNNLNDCGWGTVVRTFQATDDWGLTSTNSCTQVISIYEVHNYEIKFPKDADAECGTPNPDTIAYNTLGCDLITVNVNDEIYEATSDECYKVLRTYKVINWCEWDGEAAPIVIGRDEDCDNNPGDEDVWVIVRTEWNGPNPIFTSYVDRDNDETNTNPFIGTSRCTNLPKPYGHWANSTINTELTSVGHWQYTQVIKVYDFVAPTAEVEDYGAFCSETADCYGDVAIQFTVTELCDLDVVTAEGFLDAFADGVLDGPATVVEVSRDEAASTITYEISGNYPIGAHMFGVHIEDGCENVLWLELPFEVVDCKAPTPICINGLTVTLMPQPDGCCAMAIWASDFIASDVEDCTEPVKYSIHLQDEVLDGTEIPSPDVTGLVLDCNNDATEEIRIYSWDSAYNPYAVQPDGTIGGPNYDYCETYVLVQAWVTCDDGPVGATVAGGITTEETEGLEGAEVELAGGEFLDALTATDGSYEFTDVTTGFDITITPHLDANPLNGVSTFDLVLISKHILGVQLLDSPYKMISADVNNSSTITTADMIQLRKLILGVYTDFPNNTSWRFVDASYVFPDASNPWAQEFPEVINIVGLDSDQLNNNFISAKIGDVNGSATPNVTSVEERNVNGLFTIDADDVTVKSGNQYSVSFTAADLAKIEGYQFSLTFDNAALSLTDIEYGVATEENFGMTYLSEGIITTSWNGEAADNSVLFTLVFTANTEAQLSDLIGVSSRITVAEAYDNNGTLDVAINFNGEVAAAGFEVYQNTPNPFRGETVIGYNLPEDADVTITIQDVTGKTLEVINQTAAKGYNAYTLNAANLGTGVLYYTVSTNEFTATKKMILVK